jgi:hypothetical protein
LHKATHAWFKGIADMAESQPLAETQTCAPARTEVGYLDRRGSDADFECAPIRSRFYRWAVARSKVRFVGRSVCE